LVNYSTCRSALDLTQSHTVKYQTLLVTNVVSAAVQNYSSCIIHNLRTLAPKNAML